MSNRLAMAGIALSLVFLTSCSSMGRWGSGRDVFETGLALFQQGRFAEAIPYLEDATHINPKDGAGFFLPGPRLYQPEQMAPGDLAVAHRLSLVAAGRAGGDHQLDNRRRLCRRAQRF